MRDLFKHKRQAYVQIFRKDRYFFPWTYDDFKTYDTVIIQHFIPLKEGAKPFQQNLRKIHLMLEPFIQKKLKKLPNDKIIFKICHSSWVVNLVPIKNK